ncbi:hypothetical protein L6164_036840 [Bauhinia variegata]|uniref:Uncharacterized protein n=1 Tax=Bauhinia variegata TaxID=167791 RepID=A0ACB9KIB3_BAUVA|nr:hypothetical protein L6164_036840 [Bauhinia variegata]
MNLIARITVLWSRKNILFLCCYFITILAETSSIDQCLETRCGTHGPSIHFPFRLKHKQPERCGYQSGFDLFCTDTNKTVLQLPSSVNVSVKSINYKAQFSDPSQSFVVFKCPGKHHRNADSRYLTSYSNFSCLDEAGIQVIAFPSDTRIMEAPLLSCTRIKCEANNGKCKLKESISGLQPDCEGLPIQNRRVVAILISLLLIFAGGGVLDKSTSAGVHRKKELSTIFEIE